MPIMGGGFEEAQAEQRHIILSDYHIRTFRDSRGRVRTAHDAHAMAVAEAFMEAWRPTDIWYNGDMLDFHQVSKYCKARRDRAGLAEDIEEWRALLDRQAKYGARRHFNKGNHEARLEPYIAANADPLADLEELRFDRLLHLEKHGISVAEYGERVMLAEGLEITHGDVARKMAGYSAHAQLKGISGISGHTHRLAQVWKRDRRGASTWLEGGCLCSLSPDYTPDPDWQQGFTTVTVKGGLWHAELVPIHRTPTTYWLMWGGRTFIHRV